MVSFNDIHAVLSRLISEETTKIKNSLELINDFSYQLTHYDSMRDEIKEEVRANIYEQMLQNKWDNWAEELKEKWEGSS